MYLSPAEDFVRCVWGGGKKRAISESLYFFEEVPGI